MARRRGRRRLIGLLALGIVAVGLAAVTRTGTGNEGPSRQRVRAQAEKALSKRPLTRTGRAFERVFARTPYVTIGGGRSREIALTFDDGPGPFTPKVVDVLRRYRVPATFFIVGQSLNSFGRTLRLEMRDGFAIGDHTENHRPMALLSERAQRAQLIDQAFRVHSYGAGYPRLFRPPYRSFNATTLAVVHKLHMLMVLWTVDSADYRQPGTKAIISRVISGARPGAIVLMHDAGGTRTQTVAALPRIIRRLRAMRYRLVTVPQLLRDDPPLTRQRLPHGRVG
jgi:peptidoglycan/xylan/chitin deacetylase (PgdA/CDA1 family)